MPNFTGSRCEVNVFGNNTITVSPPINGTTTTFTTTTLSTSTVTFEPRCNYTITMLNDGAYTARLRVIYTIDGIQQPMYVSPNLPIIGNRASVTIPWYARDIFVTGEKLFVNWYTIFSETGLNTTNACTKCYKTWGVVTNPQWDYYLC